MAQDQFNRPEDLAGPAYRAVSVVPDDNNDLAYVSRGVYVGSSGNLTVDMALSGTQIEFTAVPAGSLLPIAVSRIYETGTSASAIVAIW